MNQLKLRVYPDPILTEISEPVTEFSDDLHQFCVDMYDVMTRTNGVGLSAVQVGVLKRVIVMGVPKDAFGLFVPQHFIVNPEIVDQSEDLFKYSEGCLSVPEFFDDRLRPKRITLRYQRPKDGQYELKSFSNLEAFCIQHEMDHLEGKLFIDDLSPLKKDRIRKKIEKTRRKDK